ncbi:MAG: hypothetical protein SX243_22415 [Acidobacteriota bacterium]|nr:hypothetical protein [Acidobacteriota bacterium]
MIDWVMRDRGVSFRHAVELLRSDLPPAAVVEARSSEPMLPALVEADAEDEEMLRQVVGFNHETLQESREPLSYLESRGLAHPELIERFQLGFANRFPGPGELLVLRRRRAPDVDGRRCRQRRRADP